MAFCKVHTSPNCLKIFRNSNSMKATEIAQNFQKLQKSS